MGKVNFRGYLISRFFPTREIRENLMHAKNSYFTVITFELTRHIRPQYLNVTDGQTGDLR